MEWSRLARAAIAEVDRTLPADAPLQARKAAVDAAYPFGQRAYWPYKAWLKARRDYLRGYGYAGGVAKAVHLSPLERLMGVAGDPPAPAAGDLFHGR